MFAITKASTDLPRVERSFVVETLIRQALDLILKKYDVVRKSPYFQRMVMTPAQAVKFMDERVFMNNLGGTNQAPTGCHVNGFTSYELNTPTMYLNRATAKPATIVHEMLHYFTHRSFLQSTPTKFMEGTTEYFTRKVLNRINEQNLAEYRFQMNRAGFYDDELDEVNAIRDMMKGPLVKTKPSKGFLKSAYFLGDPAALGLLKQFLV